MLQESADGPVMTEEEALHKATVAARFKHKEGQRAQETALEREKRKRKEKRKRREAKKKASKGGGTWGTSALV